MQLKGKHVLNAPASSVWKILMDAHTLSKVVPGITSLERLGENSFKSMLTIQLGPVTSSFAGNLQLEDLSENESFTLKMQQNSKIGNANVIIKINLVELNDHQTEVTFDGDAKLSGILASMGQRVVGGVANTLTQKFFDNIEKELEKKTLKVEGLRS